MILKCLRCGDSFDWPADEAWTPEICGSCADDLRQAEDADRYAFEHDHQAGNR